VSSGLEPVPLSGKPRCLYDILGVPRGADGRTIKCAYHNLLLRVHPDKGHAVSSDEFHEVQRAYSILSNPSKRDEYDRTGMMGKQMSASCSPEDLLTTFWANRTTTMDVVRVLEISVAESAKGATRLETIRRNVLDDDGCPRPILQTVEVIVPRGCPDRKRIVVHNMADEEPNKTPGNYIFVVSVCGPEESANHQSSLSGAAAAHSTPHCRQRPNHLAGGTVPGPGICGVHGFARESEKGHGPACEVADEPAESSRMWADVF